MKSLLIVDDEQNDIAKLQQVLQPYQRSCTITHVSSAEDAITQMQEALGYQARSTKKRNGQAPPYSGIVTDHHMEGLTGKQLIRMILGDFGDGRIHHFNYDEIAEVDTEIAEAVETHFRGVKEYWDFVDAYRHTPLVLFSSRPYGDGHQGDTFMEDVFVGLKKTTDTRDYTAERAIIHFLQENNAL